MIFTAEHGIAGVYLLQFGYLTGNVDAGGRGSREGIMPHVFKLFLSQLLCRAVEAQLLRANARDKHQDN